jgi:Protein of unknown function DUF262
MLQTEIVNAQRLVHTDSYQMSLGEIVGMYQEKELTINPAFQRLFRWDINQKSKLIESILLGIPIPPIFVFQTEEGTWELIDGLQRLSTILEFMGLLLGPNGKARHPSYLEGTKYLRSLHNCVWSKTDLIPELPSKEQTALDQSLKLTIKRARIGVQILKQPSEPKTKFDLFQRLNSGGTQANAQELRNSILIMVNTKCHDAIKKVAESDNFCKIFSIQAEQREKQKHMEYACRFLVHLFVPYDGKLDIEEYIDFGIISLAEGNDWAKKVQVIGDAVSLLVNSSGVDALRKFDGKKHAGKVSLVSLEAIAVGVAANITAISKLPDPKDFVKLRIQQFWSEYHTNPITSLGMRGTTRIQKTVPLGRKWFKPK